MVSRLLSIYMAIIYGTLFMLFGAFPIVYQEERGWSAGIGGLAFLGVAVGMILAVLYYALYDNRRYQKISDKNGGFAPPEARLPATQLGGALIPIGLFWFAWTNYPSIHWMASIAAGVPFGFGMVLVFLGMMNYLIDAYTIFAASVLAANAVLRSLFGFAFPLFTTQMYDTLGIHWASTIPAFLALACVPFPFLFWKYGSQIRERCKYAAESAAFLRKLQSQTQQDDSSEEGNQTEQEEETKLEEAADRQKQRQEEREEEEEQQTIDYSYEPASELPRLEEIRTVPNRPAMTVRTKSYEGNPFDLDRVNTRESFRWEERSNRTRSRSGSMASKTSRK